MIKDKRVIALGFFDGVHLGHGALLNKCSEKARELNAEAAVLTFDVHPDNLIMHQITRMLNTQRDRDYLLEKYYGIKKVILTHFDEEFMRMPWEKFVEDELVNKYGAIHLIAGYDFHFGYRGMGNPERLREKCAQLGIGCDIMGKVVLDGITVSSTYIRGLVAQGEIELANKFLGHPHTISGTVVQGRKLGRTIGIPTVNIPLQADQLAPLYGVYASRVILPDGSAHEGVTDIGVKPTVASDAVPAAETYIIDYEGDLYGREVRLELYKFLRPEKKFSGVDELKRVIEGNIQETRDYFA